MANGDKWQLPDGREGLEDGRDGKFLRLALMRDDWPFPNAPESFLRSRCKLMPSRYLQGEVPEESPL